MSVSLRPLGLAAVSTIAIGGIFLGASSASAHVTIDPTSTDAGSYTVLTVSVPHGCGDSPTTRVAISIPEGINSVTPTRHQFYDVKNVIEALETPIDDGHGGELTERVSEVIYTAKEPLPADQRDAFELSLRLPEGQAGEVLSFPSIQTCEEGETAWIEEQVEGQSEPDSPAPTIVLTVADEAGHGHAATAVKTKTESTDSQGAGPIAWAGVILGALGLAAGGTAVLRSRKTS